MSDADQKQEDDVLRRMLATPPREHKRLKKRRDVTPKRPKEPDA